MFVRPCIQNVSEKNGELSLRAAVCTHGKAAQSSTKEQVEWLHLRPCLVPSWRGVSRTIWDCCWFWGVSSPPRAGAPATLPKGKPGTAMNEWVCRPASNLSIYEIVFNLFGQNECCIEIILGHAWTESIRGRKLEFLWNENQLKASNIEGKMVLTSWSSTTTPF